MHPIAAVARLSLVGIPESADPRAPSKRLDDLRLVNAAISVPEAGAKYIGVFTDRGLPADVIARLGGAIETVRAAVAGHSDALSAVKSPHSRWNDQLASARNNLAVVNAMVVNQLDGRADLLAAWRMAKQVNTKPGDSGDEKAEMGQLVS
jgi:hypothetical protein